MCLDLSKTKIKIMNSEYFYHKSLLDNKEEPLSVTITSGMINLHHGQKSKCPLTLNQWTYAFFIFSAIYSEKFPNEGANILKYLFYDLGNEIFILRQCLEIVFMTNNV